MENDDNKPYFDSSRAEEYLNYMVGSSSSYPQDAPQSRLEVYLKYLCEHGGGGGGSSFEFYEVTLSNNKFYHGTEELNYSKLVAKFNDNNCFLYLKNDNLLYIPSIETDNALAFSVAWTRREDVGDAEYAQPYISRVIINSDEVVRSEQTGLQSTELLLDSFENYEEQYGDKMVPTAKAVKDLASTQSVLIDVGRDQTTYDSKVFPNITKAKVKEIYDTYTAGTNVIIRWNVMGILPIEATVISSDNAGGENTIDFIIHNEYMCEYSYTSSMADTDYTTVKIIKMESTGGQVEPVKSVSYAELVALRDAGELVPGQEYRITDYTCTTSKANTQSAGHVFDILVKAADENTLDENAKAALHEGDTYFANCKLSHWELKYCLDNDQSRFEWANTTNGKGVIYYMKDEHFNECGYDFKNIQFKRSQINTNYNYFVPEYILTPGSQITFGPYTFRATSGYAFLYTFDLKSDTSRNSTDYSLNGYSHHNIIKEAFGSADSLALPNVLLLGQCSQNTIERSCSNCTIESGQYNILQGNNNNIVLATSYSKYNIIGRFSKRLLVAGQDNVFGVECDNITVQAGSGGMKNTFGDGCQNITVYGANNTFGNNCTDINFDYNIKASGGSYNTFGNNCTNIKLNGKYSSKNVFGNYCSYITVSQYNEYGFQYNIIESFVKYLTINATSDSSPSNTSLKNLIIETGVLGSSSTNQKTITEPCGLTNIVRYRPVDEVTKTI